MYLQSRGYLFMRDNSILVPGVLHDWLMLNYYFLLFSAVFFSKHNHYIYWYSISGWRVSDFIFINTVDWDNN